MAGSSYVQVLLHATEGEEFTRETLQAGVRRAAALGITKFVVASTTGRTGVVAADVCGEERFAGQLIVVAEHYGYHGRGVQKMTSEVRQELETRGARVFVGAHVLASVERSFRFRYGGIGTQEIISDTLRRVSRGVKTSVEMSMMLADAGWVEIDEEIVAAGGSGGGADTAVVIMPTHTNDFFALSIREIIAMPRTRMSESIAEVVALSEAGVAPADIVARTGYAQVTVDRYITELESIRQGIAEGESDPNGLRHRIGRGSETTRIYMDLCALYGA